MRQTTNRILKSLIHLSIVCLLAALLALPVATAQAQRGRSFGGPRGFGGGRPFGGGNPFTQRSNPGSFNPSSPGSFNSSPRSNPFTGTRSPGRSFNRSGPFSSPGIARSTSLAPSYYSQRPTSTSTYYYEGHYVPAYHYGFWSGYSFAWGAPAWYYWTPFHPAFYYYPPVYYAGVAYPGGFNWLHFFLSILFFIVLIWLIGRIFFSRRGVSYTSY